MMPARNSLQMEELKMKGRTEVWPANRNQRNRGSYTYIKENRLYDKDYNRREIIIIFLLL